MASRTLSRILSRSRSFTAFSVASQPYTLRSIAALPNIKAHFSPNLVRGFASKRIVNPSERERGLDFEHWFIGVLIPEGMTDRDEIIDLYVKILSSVVGSEEEARMKLYSVSTQCYFAFGALISEELASKLRGDPRVRLVHPDCYVNKKLKDYGGEPFVNGKAVPYDPIYHVLYWIAQSRIMDPFADKDAQIQATDNKMSQSARPSG